MTNLVDQKYSIFRHFDVFGLASAAANADGGCTGMPRTVTRTAFLHALCAKLEIPVEGVEKKLLQGRASI